MDQGPEKSFEKQMIPDSSVSRMSECVSRSLSLLTDESSVMTYGKAVRKIGSILSHLRFVGRRAELTSKHTYLDGDSM